MKIAWDTANGQSGLIDNVYFATLRGNKMTVCNGEEMENTTIEFDEINIKLIPEDLPVKINVTSIAGHVYDFGSYYSCISFGFNGLVYKFGMASIKECYSIYLDEASP